VFPFDCQKILKRIKARRGVDRVLRSQKHLIVTLLLLRWCGWFKVTLTLQRRKAK